MMFFEGGQDSGFSHTWRGVGRDGVLAIGDGGTPSRPGGPAPIPSPASTYVDSFICNHVKNEIHDHNKVEDEHQATGGQLQ